jgi:hypothetical protein
VKRLFALWWKDRREARERAHSAAAELARSKRLLSEDRHLAEKISRAHHRNQFSDIIRDALEVGYQGGKGARGEYPH